jgi:hypothetical protein
MFRRASIRVVPGSEKLLSSRNQEMPLAAREQTWILRHMEEPVLREETVGRLRIVTSLERRPKADRLTVFMNAYCDRSKQRPPLFHRWPLSESFGHILRISDPTLLLGDWVQVSAFLGTEHEDPIPLILTMCQRIAAELGVERDQIVYLGASGGGFGALQCAVRDPSAIGIGINPITRIRAYAGLQFAEEIANLFRPGSKMAELCDLYPERFSVAAAAERAMEGAMRPRLGLVQNRTDLTHFRPHYVSLCKSLDVPADGGVDSTGHFHTETFDLPGGHGILPDMTVVEGLMTRMTNSRAAAPLPTSPHT